MKNPLLIFAFVLLASKTEAQDKVIDSLAIRILDRMSNVIGNLHSCSFTVKTEYDSLDGELGFLKHHDEHQLFFSGSNKFLMFSNGEKGHRGFWYNGDQLVFYSFTNNHYGYMNSPNGGTIKMIDSVHEKYDIDFPAADFFYPTFTDDLIGASDRIEYLGQQIINGANCFYVVAKGKEIGVQLWIREDAFFLPVKMVIVSHYKGSPREYEANFSDWMINPVLPDAIFDFVPPPTATPLTIMPAK